METWKELLKRLREQNRAEKRALIEQVARQEGTRKGAAFVLGISDSNFNSTVHKCGADLSFLPEKRGGAGRPRTKKETNT